MINGLKEYLKKTSDNLLLLGKSIKKLVNKYKKK
jgi:hypothetical protein